MLLQVAIFHFLMAEYYSVIYIIIYSFIHWLDTGCFYILTSDNNVAMNVVVDTFSN